MPRKLDAELIKSLLLGKTIDKVVVGGNVIALYFDGDSYIVGIEVSDIILFAKKGIITAPRGKVQ